VTIDNSCKSFGDSHDQFSHTDLTASQLGTLGIHALE
jgi:hypothetical protein